MSLRPRGLWRNTDFLKLWTGQTISQLGSRITREGIPLTAALVLHAPATQMGWLSALGGASVLVFGLLAGVWVDRWPRRPTLIATDVGRALILASIPLAAAAGALSMRQLYAVAALAGVLTVFFDVAYQSYVPTLVEPEEILEANSKLALSSSTAEIAGPGLTGVLVQLITAPAAILLDAFSFLLSALMVARVRKPEPKAPPREPEPLVSEALAGLRFVFSDPVLRALGLRSATAFLFMGFMGALYVLYAVEALRMPPAVLGLVIAVGGVGAMAGAAVAKGTLERLGLGPTFLIASGVQGVTSFLIPLAAALPSWAVVVLMVQQLVGDMAFTVYSIHELSLRQRRAPERVLGRVNSGMHLLARGVWPLGALAGGYCAARFGLRPTLTLAAAGVLSSTLWLLFSPLGRWRPASSG